MKKLRQPNSRPGALARHDVQVKVLVEAARAIRARAYAPYSLFRVGAAVLDDQGRLHAGCNVENASYGLTLCAERNAIAVAVAAGARKIRAVAIAAEARPPAAPCGACRQVLAEFADDFTQVILTGPRGSTAALVTLGSLLPHAFRLKKKR